MMNDPREPAFLRRQIRHRKQEARWLRRLALTLGLLLLLGAIALLWSQQAAWFAYK